MTDYLERACEYLGVDRDDVVKYRAEGTDYIMIVDEGIAGTRKYRVPLSLLDGLSPKPATNKPAPEKHLTYRELQELAKESGIPANQSKFALYEALWPEATPFDVSLFASEEE